MWPRLRSFVAAIVGRRRFEQELREELEQHLHACAADLIEQGVPEADAHRQARRQFGSVASVQDRCRESSGLRLADELSRDVRIGWRMLVKTPLASAVALATIGVASGLMLLTAALVYSVLLRPLPFDRAGRLMAIQPAASDFEALDLRAFQSAQTSFTEVHGFYRRSVTLTRGAGTIPESLPAAFVTAGVFEMLGIQPLLGRTFRESEEFTSEVGVIIIGEELWRAWFGADPAILGRRLVIDGRQVRVLGVMPAALRFPVDEDVWLPMDFALPTAANPGSGRSFSVFGRLRDDVSIGVADAEARVLFTRIWGDVESTAPEPASPRVSPFAARYLRAGLPWLLLVTGLASAGVLLVACANLATLSLARSMSRRLDVSVRMALGAGRLRVVRQFAAESLVLAVPGTVAGWWLAVLGVRWLADYQTRVGLPYWAEIRLDLPVLLLAVCLTLAVTLSASLTPALRATRSARQTSMAMPSRGSAPQSRAATWLVATQVAGSCAFLLAAGLLVKSSLSVSRVDLGFDPARVLTGQILLPEADYPDPSATMTRLLQQMESSSAIESASLVRLAPGTGPAFAWTFAVEGEAYGPGRPHPRANGVSAATGFFDTMRIDLVEGRDFTPQESRYGSEPVLIANRTLAQRYLGPNPIGRRIQIGNSGGGPWLAVVGIVADTYIGSASGGIGLESESTPQLYLSWGAAPYAAGTLVLRTVSDAPGSLLPSIHQSLAEVAPSVPLRNAVPLTQSIEQSTWAIRLFGVAFMVFGGVTLLMSAIGLFGIMTFAVRERTREIGVRMALGAGPREVLALVARRVAMPVPIGVVLGIGASVPLVRALRLLLFDVAPADVTVYAVVVLSLIGAAVLATCGPVVAATRIDPVRALRAD